MAAQGLNMWPFNNKKIKLETRMEKFEVGKTLVRIDLEDGTILHKEVVGYVYVYSPYLIANSYICPPTSIINSMESASSFEGRLKSRTAVRRCRQRDIFDYSLDF
jgi:hypothetical protein